MRKNMIFFYETLRNYFTFNIMVDTACFLQGGSMAPLVISTSFCPTCPAIFAPFSPTIISGFVCISILKRDKPTTVWECAPTFISRALNFVTVIGSLSFPSFPSFQVRNFNPGELQEWIVSRHKASWEGVILDLRHTTDEHVTVVSSIRSKTSLYTLKLLHVVKLWSRNLWSKTLSNWSKLRKQKHVPCKNCSHVSLT